MKVKIILCLFSLSLIFGCAGVPVNTTTLIESQPIAKRHKGIYFVVIDDRSERIKSENSFITTHAFLSDPNYVSYGDKSFDKSLGTVFKDMLVRRFGNDSTGYLTEIKLKVFNPVYYLYSVGPILYKQEFRCMLTADVGLLDYEKKYIFYKTYTIEIKEIAEGESIVRNVMLNTLIKSFNKFADEFEIDISRIRMIRKDGN